MLRLNSVTSEPLTYSARRMVAASVAGWDVGELDPEVAGIGRIQQAGAARDGAAAHEAFEFGVEVLHPFEHAVLHRLDKRFAFTFPAFDVFARAHRRLQD